MIVWLPISGDPGFKKKVSGWSWQYAAKIAIAKIVYN